VGHLLGMIVSLSGTEIFAYWFNAYLYYLKCYTNVTSKIGKPKWIIIIKAHHVQAKHWVRNAQKVILALQFGEFFGVRILFANVLG
jgi:hypothetical protein